VSAEPEVTRYECDDPYALHESDVGGLVDYDDYARAIAERDARERELHDETVMLHTALLGRNCTEPGAVSACHPMVCDCGTPFEDFTFRDLCEAVTQLRAQLAAAREALKDIASNYDHDEQTREHTKGYGARCRVCTAEAALTAAMKNDL